VRARAGSPPAGSPPAGVLGNICSTTCATPQQQQGISGRVGFLTKYFVPLFAGGARNIPQRFLSAKPHEQGLTRDKPVQGKARPDKRHRAHLPGDVQFLISTLHSCHDTSL